jgi:hypothetical protein
MARKTKPRKARRYPPPPPTSRSRFPRGFLVLAGVAVVGLVVAGALLWSSSGEPTVEVFEGVPFTDPGPIHVHGLGINPADGSLFIATHTGLFRVGKDSQKAVRIADRYQDTMGFSIVGPDHFLGSGHPDAREQTLPPRLGLIESTDAGRTWDPISLLGAADFHVLRSTGKHVYGYDASNDRLLASTDEGRSWQELDKPVSAPIVDLAPDPSDPRRLAATSVGAIELGLYTSRNRGESWTRLNDAVGLLAWPAPARLYLADGEGNVFLSSDGGRTLSRRGEIGGQPAAFLAVGKDELYAALHDGTIKRSTDGGSSWTVRSSP